MISFVENKNIDKIKWDRCIDHSFNKSFFSYSYTLDILAAGWNALVLDDYEAVLPVIARKKYTISYLYQPFFINFFDVYSSDKKKHGDIASDFLKAIPAYYRYWDIYLAAGLHKNIPELEFIERKLQLLDISIPHDQLKSKYSDNLKRNIKKAIKEEIKIEFDFSVDTHVKDFKRENSKKIKAFSSSDYKTMTKLLDELKKRNKAFIVVAKAKSGRVCGSASFIICDNRLIYFKSSTNDYGKQNGAMHLLIDTVIEKCGGRYTLLDFYGSNVASVARFNESFNTYNYLYYRVKKNKLPPLLKLIKK